MIEYLLIGFSMVIQSVGTWWYIRRCVRKAKAEAYDKAGYLAEMWTVNKYGITHECGEIHKSCDDLGELADKLREMAKMARKGL